MAASYNKVILVGNLTRDPEIRYINSGSPVTKFRIAVNPNKRDAKPEDTMYVDIVAWERLAETCNTYLKKGSPVLVEGRLSIRSYDDTKLKDDSGQPIRRTATEVVISTMQMLSSRRDDAEGDHGGFNGGGRPAAVSAPSRAGGESSADDLEDEIPF
ncbi:MAG TPA: single-stranded DNA-binding protein [Candidatus Cybelea sp.]|jgi:single-strand DNA-binding protein|nr:single-stranded DNA-binding protein [Candidatus Cybelea sp.]